MSARRSPADVCMCLHILIYTDLQYAMTFFFFPQCALERQAADKEGVANLSPRDIDQLSTRALAVNGSY